jgi:hypothetical protein
MKLVKREEKKTRASAFRRALARLAARSREPQPAKVPPPAPAELFIAAFECSETGRPFQIIWHRPEGQARYTVREIVKTDEGAAQAQANDKGSLRMKALPVEAIDFSGRQCPHCGWRSNFVRCGCGKNLCGSATYLRGGIRRIDVKSCGCSFALGNSVTTFSGCAGPERPQDGPQPKALRGNPQAARLPHKK